MDVVSEVNPTTGAVIQHLTYAGIYPASHYVTSDETREKALREIYCEMEERVEYFKANNKYIEAQRIEERTKYDLEMLQEIGYCSGVENYSRVLSGRAPGSTPYTLMDYFPDDFLMFIDESHVTLPQVHAMHGGDRARKTNLVDYGFRLPSAFDNRPLRFDEFEKKINQIIYVSATPAKYERERATVVAEQIIRPTGLLDPVVEVRPIEGQIDDLIGEINARIDKKERVLITTLTKVMAENLTEYLEGMDIKCRYMHFGVDTIERMEIIRDLRLGVFDVLIGINLLREGLDLPEVSLVAVLDADKEGFLRSETSLIQTIGRAARNSEGKVIMYADNITDSMRNAINETERRRAKQMKFNEENGIIPTTVKKDVREIIEIASKSEGKGKAKKKLTKKEKEVEIAKLRAEMMECSKRLEFERAAYLRDLIIKIENE